MFCRAELCKVHVPEGALNMRGILLVGIFLTRYTKLGIMVNLDKIKKTLR